jgi:hypothetical protein
MTDEQLKQRDYHTGRKIVNGSDVKQRRIDRLHDKIVALLEAEINHDVRGYEVANAVCQRLATRLFDGLPCTLYIALAARASLVDQGMLRWNSSNRTA